LAPLGEGQLEQKRFLNLLANQAHVHRHAAADSLALHVIERATPPGSVAPAGYLFVVNPSAWPVRSRLSYTDPCTGEMATLPRLLKGVEFSGQGALILSLELTIPGAGLTIAYSTSQVQDWSVGEDHVSITLYGPPETMGETAFRLEAGALPSVGLPAQAQPMADERGPLLITTYPHYRGTTILRLQK